MTIYERREGLDKKTRERERDRERENDRDRNTMCLTKEDRVR